MSGAIIRDRLSFPGMCIAWPPPSILQHPPQRTGGTTPWTAFPWDGHGGVARRAVSAFLWNDRRVVRRDAYAGFVVDLG
ncbi:hypothetical protein Ssi02_77970 [Sinosporangium siamense]|uniref:Uncharacterized protein n=1 Tax=Sinosporangium siamense TaxID=1367973 RepID=A0A919RPK2_9ACTN|nr:hypothetical protein Ssi02_77970 [Sinosporangium siamense]